MHDTAALYLGILWMCCSALQSLGHITICIFRMYVQCHGAMTFPSSSVGGEHHRPALYCEAPPQPWLCIRDQC